MKFFTREWHTKWNTTQDAKERELLEERTKRLMSDYEQQFNLVKPHLNSRFLSFYDRNHGFHDSEIKEIIVKRRKGRKKPIVDVIILLDIDKKLYQLKYESVFSMNYIANYMDEDIDSMRYREQFDSWMYDEFSLVEETGIRHNISFLSGSELVIDFSKIGVSRKTE